MAGVLVWRRRRRRRPGASQIRKRRRHFGVSALLGGALEVLLGVRRVALLKANERHALERSEVAGRKPQHRIPFVECALQLASIDGNTREQVMRVRVVRMPLEPAHGDLERQIELALPPECLAEREKGEARPVARELVAPATDVVSHGRPPRAPPAPASVWWVT